MRKDGSLPTNYGDITFDEYMEWKLRFPTSAAEETHEELKKLREKRKADNE